MSDHPVSLTEGLHRSGLSHLDLWLRYIAIGGEASPMELEAYVNGLLHPDPHQHDMIAQALNERFLELGGDHPVGYSG